MLALVALCAALAWPDDSTLVPRNAGHSVGDPLWARIFLASLLGALAAYGAGVLLVARRGVSLVAAVVIALGVQLAPLAAPLLLSTDAWTYWDYGRIGAVDGGNPYRDPPVEFPRDPAFPHVGEDWQDTSSVYGPAFTLASEPVARAVGGSADAAAWVYKTLAALFVLLAALLAARLAGNAALAWAFVGWNPLLAVHAAGGGHNDAWLGALLVGALALAAVGRRRGAGAVWALAVLVKWVPVLFLPLRLVEARARGRRVGHAGFAAAGVIVLALATWRYGLHWLSAFGPLASNAGNETSFAIPHRLEQAGLPEWLAVGVCFGGFLVAYGVLLRRAARGRARLGLTAGLFLLATPWLAAWYIAWVVPLAAAEEDRQAQALAFGLSVYLAWQAVPI